VIGALDQCRSPGICLQSARLHEGPPDNFFIVNSHFNVVNLRSVACSFVLIYSPLNQRILLSTTCGRIEQWITELAYHFRKKMIIHVVGFLFRKRIFLFRTTIAEKCQPCWTWCHAWCICCRFLMGIAINKISSTFTNRMFPSWELKIMIELFF